MCALLAKQEGGGKGKGEGEGEGGEMCLKRGSEFSLVCLFIRLQKDLQNSTAIVRKGVSTDARTHRGTQGHAETHRDTTCHF